MRTDGLDKRLTALEASQPPGGSPPRCDPRRRLSNCIAAIEGRPWTCTGTPERRAWGAGKLVQYRKYFEDLDAGVAAPRWVQ